MKNIKLFLVIFSIACVLNSCGLFGGDDDGFTLTPQQKQEELCNLSNGTILADIEGIDWDIDCLQGTLVDSTLVFQVGDSTIEFNYSFLILHSYKVHEVNDDFMDAEFFSIALNYDGERTYKTEEDGVVVSYQDGQFPLNGNQNEDANMVAYTNNAALSDPSDQVKITAANSDKIEGTFNVVLHGAINAIGTKRASGSFEIHL